MSFPLSLPSEFELPEQILGFVQDERAAGRRSALIVVTGLSGGSMRQIGSLAAVSESGEMAGYISNGCIDSDIALQAAETLSSGQVSSIRYGAGSPFLDLQLPCGGSVDLMILPNPDRSVLDHAVLELRARRPVSLRFCADTGLKRGDDQRGIQFHYVPGLRLIVAGRGAVVASMIRHAISSDIATEFASPEALEHARFEALGARRAFDLTSPWTPVSITADPWTAVLLLFHDHVWEAPILTAATGTSAFYIGCLGSVRTQQNRRRAMRSEGMSSEQIERVRGPIGLIPSSRSANDLAISVLADIRSAERAQAREKAAA